MGTFPVLMQWNCVLLHLKNHCYLKGIKLRRFDGFPLFCFRLLQIFGVPKDQVFLELNKLKKEIFGVPRIKE